MYAYYICMCSIHIHVRIKSSLIEFTRRRAAGSPEEKSVGTFMRAFYALWAAAFIFGELLPLPRLVNLQLFRSDAFFCLFGIIFAADFIRLRFEKEEPGGWALGAGLGAYANTPMEKAIRICIIEAVRYISQTIPASYYKY